MTKFASDEQYSSKEEVEDTYPGSYEILEVCGGWQVFDTATDLEIWENQV